MGGESRRIMKCKNRDKKKMDRYSAKRGGGEKELCVVFGFKTLPAAIFYLWGIWRDPSYAKLFELEEHFPWICDSFFLEIDGPAPEPAVFQSTCSLAPTVPNLGGGWGWVSTCWGGREGHIKQPYVYIRRNKQPQGWNGLDFADMKSQTAP